MADAKITELTPWTTPIDTDVLPIVDVTAGATKKITKANLATNIGIQKFNTNPTVGAFSEGKLYYDTLWKTLSLDIDTDVTMQIGQETLAYCKNVTGSAIPNGSVVYITGASGGYPTIDLADATDINKSFVLGVVTKLAGIDATTGMGHVCIRGHVHDMNTDAWNVGTTLYLSATPGALTSTAPTAGQYDVRIGRVMIKHASTGSVYVNVRAMMNLTDLGDVTITSPIVDNTLRYNGVEWVNSAGTTVSGSGGVQFFADDATIIAAPTNDNTHHVETLLKTPRTAAEQPEVVENFTVSSNTVFGEGYLYNVNLNRTLIDAGTWVHETYCSANTNLNNAPQLIRNTYRVMSGTGTLSTVRTLGSAAVTQTVTTGLFIAGDATADLTTCSYLQTPQGLYEITGYGTAKTVTITVPNGGTPYADETNIPAGSWRIWRKLFGVTQDVPFIGTAYGLVTTNSVQGAFTLTADGTDRLGCVVLAKATGSKVINFLHNGALRASRFTTPLITLHGNLAGLQGGTGTVPTEEYWHLTTAQHTIATQAADTTVSGYLSTADWDVFNDKQSALVNSAGLAGAVNDETGTGVVVFNNSPTILDDITVGTPGTATGIIKMRGTTSGVVDVTVGAEAGTYTLTLPVNDGDANQVLTTNGSGVTSWATPAAGSDIIQGQVYF